MLFISRRALCNTTVIGFTGTIASGKSARCRRLVQDAINVQRQRSGHEALTETAALELASALPRSSSATVRADSPPSPTLPIGVKYVNADLVGHDIYLPGKPCYHELLQRFGSGILASASATARGLARDDDTQPMIDRKALGALVFADKAKLHELNTICWPYISAAIVNGLQDAEVQAFDKLKQRHLLVVVEAALLLELGGILQRCSDIWLSHCAPDVAVTRVQARDGLSESEAQRRVASQAPFTAQQRKLVELGFTEEKGNLVLFDTSRLALEDGLRAVDQRFESFWQVRMTKHERK